MLRAENLQIRRDQKIVLADVTLDVRPGEVLVCWGPMERVKAHCWPRCVGS